MKTAVIIGVVITALMFVAFIPTLSDSVVGTRRLDCLNASFPVYNVTDGSCFDGTNMSQGTVSQEYPDNALSVTEYAILGLVILVAIIGVVFYIYSKTMT